jgi:hypothetical protein
MGFGAVAARKGRFVLMWMTGYSPRFYDFMPDSAIFLLIPIKRYIHS